MERGVDIPSILGPCLSLREEVTLTSVVGSLCHNYSLGELELTLGAWCIRPPRRTLVARLTTYRSRLLLVRGSTGGGPCVGATAELGVRPDTIMTTLLRGLVGCGSGGSSHPPWLIQGILYTLFGRNRPSRRLLRPTGTK